MNDTKKKIKVCITDDNRLNRIAFNYSLSEFCDIEVSAVFDNFDSCFEYLKQNKTDIVIAAFNPPSMNGIKAAKVIKDLYPEVKTIILTAEEKKDYLIKALTAGASAYVTKDVDFDELRNVILSVNKGSLWLDSKVAPMVKDIFRKEIIFEDGEKPKYNLTDREKDVLWLVSCGLSNIEISKKLCISSHTAKAYVSHIMAKLSVTDRVQAAVKACKMKLF